MGKVTVSSINGTGKTGQLHPKKPKYHFLILLHYFIYKKYSKWVKGLNKRLETIKKSKRKTQAVNYLTLVLVIFFGYVSPDKGNKSQNKQMKLHQTKKFLPGDGNQQNGKATHWAGEGSCKWHVRG